MKTKSKPLQTTAAKALEDIIAAFNKNTAATAAAFNNNYTITAQTNTTLSYIGNLWHSWNPVPTNSLSFGPNTQFVPTTLAPTPARPAALPPIRFNKYVNGSDLLEEFIAFLGTEGVRKSEVMSLPVELFIKWLVIRACEVDQEDPGIILVLPPRRSQPRCLGCGRWMERSVTLTLHGDRCAQRHFARQAA